MKKVIYFIILIILIIFSWIYRDPGKRTNSGHQNTNLIIAID